jgi:hypothetical protein
MKYAAFALVLVGVLIACFAGYQYGSGASPDQEQNSSVVEGTLPLVFGVLLLTAGASMWLFGRKWFSVSSGFLICRPASATETGAAARTIRV